MIQDLPDVFKCEDCTLEHFTFFETRMCGAHIATRHTAKRPTRHTGTRASSAPCLRPSVTRLHGTCWTVRDPGGVWDQGTWTPCLDL